MPQVVEAWGRNMVAKVERQGRKRQKSEEMRETNNTENEYIESCACIFEDVIYLQTGKTTNSLEAAIWSSMQINRTKSIFEL